jgi:asparagine synthase (glutamine-hydrolysing)
LEHTFLMRDGASLESFYFDNFYSAFSEVGQTDLLTPEAVASAGDAYQNSMDAWNRSSGDLLHRLLYTDINTYLVELLMKQDQMSMAASVESRVPFLDHVLVEFAAGIPAKYATKGLSGKLILKSAVKDLLPREIVHREKMGFPTPWTHWLAGPQLDSIELLLTETRTLDRGLFRPEALRRLFAEHRSGRRDHGDRIWRLLNLELWMRVCLEHGVAADGMNSSALVSPGRPNFSAPSL